MSTNPDGDESVESIENTVPEASPAVRDELIENVTPDDSPSYTIAKLDVEGMESKTRRVLAYGAGIVLTAFYTATFVLYSTGVLKDLGSIMAMFSGLQTLTAAAFGFYFAKTTGNK